MLDLQPDWKGVIWDVMWVTLVLLFSLQAGERVGVAKSGRLRVG